jgi:phosphopantothenoylcysteine synthetase/decarboxylase
MRVLVTAGNTETPIDRVRVITNVFTGRTGAALALSACKRGHHVELMTSRPEAVSELWSEEAVGDAPDLASDKALAESVWRCGKQFMEALFESRWRTTTYRTFDDLRALLQETVKKKPLDVIVHAAAVSDYLVAGVFSPASGTMFDEGGCWQGTPAALVDRAAGKVKSDEQELWLRLKRAPKLIDAFRSQWGFQGILVKFKLEVDVNEAQLIEIAEPSRVQSGADLMVANTLLEADWALIGQTSDWALIGPIKGRYERVMRADLPDRLWSEVESLHERRSRG